MDMRKVALITDGWRRLFTYALPAGILQRIRETGEDVNLYIFNSTGNWSRDAGYNKAEYNIYNLPNLSDFDGIILELNNISSPAVLADVISNAKRSGRPVVSIANELGDFYYVGIDNYSAMKQVIAHLHEVHDCKKFWLLVGAQDNYESSCRLQGMLDYAKEHKIKIDKDDIWYGSFDYKSGLEGYKHLWDRHKELPDAIICINDNVAVAVCEAAAQMGLRRTISVSPDLIILTRLASTHPALQLWDISGKKLLTRGWIYSCGSGQERMYPNTTSPKRKCCGRRAVAVERAAAGMRERI